MATAILKNGCKINHKEEDAKKFAQRRRKLEIQIERLREQLETRIPKGRDLTSAKWLETLVVATHNIPTNEAEAKSWQDSLLRQSSKVPFPVAYETNEDMTWFKNQFGRICVKFNGLSEHSFQVYCDSRQLHWFQRFLEDQQIKKNSKNQHSSSLFTLRSGRIAWQEEEGKSDPWNVNRLTLYCSVDTRLWTTEGTNQVREEKAEKIAKIIINTKAKGKLNEEQQAHIKRQNSTLDTINNPFPRPTKLLYKGQSHILVGISLGLEKPATLTVVNGTTGQVITYRSIRQLLGDNYKLLNRQRQQKHFLSHQRQIAQTLAAPNQFRESELGEYIDRLLAKEIIAIAQTYSAGSIVLPKLDNMREQVQSEVQAKAEQKSDLIEVQQKYAKQYRVNIHQWSYGRLMANIHSSAAKAGIVIEELKQPIRGSPQEKAKELAIAAYHSRKIN
ncbi:MAG: type V CRISPR-associated protein Cas12k [Nostoc sp.]|uniref:type V CRISPR-associated protein Cas12k n=1 Tax=Nostoc sp. TaxID=1180 RepID=UPI002FEF0E1A